MKRTKVTYNDKKGKPTFLKPSMTIEDEILELQRAKKLKHISEYGKGSLETLERWQADRQRLEDELNDWKETVLKFRDKLAEANETIKRLEAEKIKWLADCRECDEKSDVEIRRLSEKPALTADDVEKMSDLVHTIWGQWTLYMLDFMNDKNVKRWKKQMNTPYTFLNEDEKESDRKIARRILEAIKEGT